MFSLLLEVTLLLDHRPPSKIDPGTAASRHC